MKIVTRTELETPDLMKRFDQMNSDFSSVDVGDVISFKTINGQIDYMVVIYEKGKHLLRLDTYRVNQGVITNDNYFRHAFLNRVLSQNVISMSIFPKDSFDMVMK